MNTNSRDGELTNIGSLTSGFGFLARITALDRAVVFAGTGNLAAALTGAVNAVLVASIFSASMQGVFYAFGSLATLYVFLDFGIGQTVIQFASHELVFANSDHGDRRRDAARERLAALSQVTVVWYATCSLLGMVVIGLMGSTLFIRADAEVVGWVGPWSLLCASSALNVLLVPLFLLIQVHKPAAVFWLYRLVYQTVYGVSLACAIYLGAGLWSIGVATCFGLLWSASYAQRYVGLLKDAWRQARSSWALWYRELWPLQWKIATTWLCSYFVNPLLVLVAFHYGGPVLAGQLGMSGTANILVLAVATAWVVTRAPRFAGLVAQGRSDELELLFSGATRAMLVVATAGGVGLWFLVWILNAIQHPFAERLVGPVPMALLVVATIVQTATIGAVTYIRAHKQESLGLVSLLTLFLSVVGSAAVAPAWGAAGIALAHLTAVGLVQMPAALWCLGRLRGSHARFVTVELSGSK